jgi:hypothetical protein
MKNVKAKFKGKKDGKKTKDLYGKQQFSKIANKGMMKRWGKSKNMGRGKT